MTLVDRLCAIGGILRIVHVTRIETSQSHEKITTRTIALKDLIVEIQSEQVHSLAQDPHEAIDGFERIFAAAGIKSPAHGWTAEKLRDLLRQEPYRTMDVKSAQKILVEKLRAEEVPAEEIIQDAVLRDKALDAFEVGAATRIEQRQQVSQERIGQIKAQIEALRKESAGLEQATQAESSQWQQWRSRKVDFEKEMAWALGYLMDQPMITVDE